jgi:hypothetical protein
MSRKTVAFRIFLASLLALFCVVASITGMLRDEKSFYAIAAVGMSFSSILIVLTMRSYTRSGQ